jgi:hypothetical protein
MEAPPLAPSFLQSKRNAHTNNSSATALHFEMLQVATNSTSLEFPTALAPCFFAPPFVFPAFFGTSFSPTILLGVSFALTILAGGLQPPFGREIHSRFGAWYVNLLAALFANVSINQDEISSTGQVSLTHGVPAQHTVLAGAAFVQFMVSTLVAFQFRSG